MLIYLQQRPTQLLHGRLFGMRPSKATPWIHVLQPVLCHTLRSLGDAPCRSAGALRERLGVEAPPLPLEAPHAEEVRAPGRDCTEQVLSRPEHAAHAEKSPAGQWGLAHPLPE